MTHQDTTPEQVKCEVCLAEVPVGDAHRTETDDYVLYFCGLECYHEWQKRQQARDEESGH